MTARIICLIVTLLGCTTSQERSEDASCDLRSGQCNILFTEPQLSTVTELVAKLGVPLSDDVQLYKSEVGIARAPNSSAPGSNLTGSASMNCSNNCCCTCFWGGDTWGCLVDC